MNIQPDFEELLKFLEEYQVDYMVVGGYAVAFHGHPRFTKDIDLFYRADQKNVEKLQKALIDFGFQGDQLPIEVFLIEGNILTFGLEPVRIDMMNQIDGVLFSDASPNTVRGKYGNVNVTFIGKEELLKNKISTKRLKDKADAEELKRFDQGD